MERTINKPRKSLKSRALNLEIRDAQNTLKKAETEVRRLRRRLAALEARANKAIDRLSTPKSSPTQKMREDLRRTVAEQRSVARHLGRLEKSVARKKTQLRDLVRQASQLDRSLIQLRKGLDVPAPPAAPPAGEQLRGARAMLQLSQQAFAEQLEISPGHLRRLEKQSGPLQEDATRLQYLRRHLRRMGVELVPAGLYVGAGGPGVRLKRSATRAQKDAMPEPADSTARARKSRRKKLRTRQVA